MRRSAGWRREQVSGHQDRGGQGWHAPEVLLGHFDEVLLGHLNRSKMLRRLSRDSQAAERGTGAFDCVDDVKTYFIQPILPSDRPSASTLPVYTLAVLLEHDGQHLFQQQHDAQRSCLASSSAPNVKMTQECFWRVPPLSAAVLVPANLFTSPSG